MNKQLAINNVNSDFKGVIVPMGTAPLLQITPGLLFAITDFFDHNDSSAFSVTCKTTYQIPYLQLAFKRLFVTRGSPTTLRITSLVANFNRLLEHSIPTKYVKKSKELSNYQKETDLLKETPEDKRACLAPYLKICEEMERYLVRLKTDPKDPSSLVSKPSDQQTLITFMNEYVLPTTQPSIKRLRFDSYFKLYEPTIPDLKTAIQSVINTNLRQQKDRLSNLLRQIHFTPEARAVQTTLVTAILSQNPLLIYAKDNWGVTPLMMAAKHGNIGAVTALLDRGANVNAKDNQGNTPLHWAAAVGHIKLAQALITAGADVTATNEDGTTPLLLAPYYGHTAVATLLIKKGADVNATDNNGTTPLHVAAYKRHTEVVEELLQAGADATVLTEKQVDLAGEAKKLLQTKIKEQEKAKASLLTLLLKDTPNITDFQHMLKTNPFLVNTTFNPGIFNRLTPLHWAAHKGHTEIAKELLKAGAKLKTKDEFDRTPLDWAINNGHIELERALKEKETETNHKRKADTEGSTGSSSKKHRP